MFTRWVLLIVASQNSDAGMKPAPRLRFYPHRKHPFHRLPFVAPRRHPGGAQYWYVPASGGYEGGYETGAALALLFLRHLQQHPGRWSGRLGWIVMSMLHAWMEDGGGQQMDQPVYRRPPALHSRRGQMVGFFALVEEWLQLAVTVDGAELAQFSEKALLQRANRGLDAASSGQQEI